MATKRYQIVRQKKKTAKKTLKIGKKQKERPKNNKSPKISLKII